MEYLAQGHLIGSISVIGEVYDSMRIYKFHQCTSLADRLDQSCESERERRNKFTGKGQSSEAGPMK